MLVLLCLDDIDEENVLEQPGPGVFREAKPGGGLWTRVASAAVGSEIRYVTGDATRPTEPPGNKVIVHVCNDVGGWGKGFVMALSKRWAEPEAKYREWHERGQGFELGAVQFVEVEEEQEGLWVANLIGQHGLRPKEGKPAIRYDAVRAGLAQVRQFAREHEASVHMPRIGCGLAGGKWDEIEPIIVAELCDHGVSVTVYDFG